jgi:hypothetical protein
MSIYPKRVKIQLKCKASRRRGERADFRLQDGKKSGKEKVLNDIETSEMLGKSLL